ncbi:hypothetical protein Bca4012_027917 [Brassica carinata]
MDNYALRILLNLEGDPVAEAKNRRSLGNIGNIASFPGVEAGKLNRPLTRNFRAHLLENANKKQINVAKRPEAVQKKARAVVKPQPQQPHEVIVISPDTNEVAKAKQDQRHDAASKKKVTYSSVLNAAASKILDIDSADKDNDHAAVEYVENMYAFYKEVEVLVVRPFILICFMDTLACDVHVKFDLSPEMLYLTISIIGRFLSLNQGPSWPDFGKKKLK